MPDEILEIQKFNPTVRSVFLFFSFFNFIYFVIIMVIVDVPECSEVFHVPGLIGDPVTTPCTALLTSN